MDTGWFFSLPIVMIITEYLMQSASPISTLHILDKMYFVLFYFRFRKHLYFYI